VVAVDNPHTPRYDEALAVAKRVLARRR